MNTFLNYYKVLGLKTSASEDEIRRAYRVLARRYHPDLNPGKESSDKFKLIAEAYSVLSDSEKKKKHDLDLNQRRVQEGPRGHRAYAEEMKKRFHAQSQDFRQKQTSFGQTASKVQPAKERATRREHQGTKNRSLGAMFQDFLHRPIKNPFSSQKKQAEPRPSGPRPQPNPQSPKEAEAKSVSIIQVSLSVEEAIFGTKKTLSIPTGNEAMKISVKIPAGVTTGDTVRMRSGKLQGQELVCIVQVAEHPYLSINKNGVVVDLPVTVSEAYHGATVQAPTLSDPIVLKIPPRSQTGFLIPLKNQGPTMRNGTKGDLLYRVIVQAPPDGAAPQYEALLKELEGSYNGKVRSELPRSLVGE